MTTFIEIPTTFIPCNYKKFKCLDGREIQFRPFPFLREELWSAIGEHVSSTPGMVGQHDVTVDAFNTVTHADGTQTTTDIKETHVFTVTAM